MRSAPKTVYYCDYCSRHGLRRSSMEKHEAGCTMNPERVCRWRIDGHSDGTRVVSIGPIAALLKARAVPARISVGGGHGLLLAQRDIDWLRDEVDGCPACMLAALRQSGVTDYHSDTNATTIFDYDDEVERLRSWERAADREQVF